MNFHTKCAFLFVTLYDCTIKLVSKLHKLIFSCYYASSLAINFGVIFSISKEQYPLSFLVLVLKANIFGQVRLNVMFWSKACSLALPPNSPLRIEEPHYEGIKRLILKLLLFYSKQSKSIRGANVVYQRIISQVDKPAIYDGVPSSFSFFAYWFCFYYFDMVKYILLLLLLFLKLKILSTHILCLICFSSYYMQSFYISLFHVWIT